MTKKKDQQPLIDKLESLRRKNVDKEITPEAVVQEAIRCPDGVLKDYLPAYFWDDARCAHEHRLDLSRELIANVTVTITSKTGGTVCVPCYVHTPGRRQGYGKLVEIKSEREVSIEALREEFGRVLAMLERALAVAEVIGLEQETRRLIDQVRGLSGKLAA